MKGLVLVMITLALTNALPLKNGNVTELETEIGDTFCFNSHLLSLKILWFRLKSNGKSYTNFVFFVFCLSFSISDGRDPVKLDEEKIGKSFRTSAILRKKHRYLLNTLLLLWAIAKSSYFFFLIPQFHTGRLHEDWWPKEIKYMVYTCWNFSFVYGGLIQDWVN